MQTIFSNDSLLKKPTAFLPLLLSLAALAMVLVHWAIFGIMQESDEGTLAHLFQILMIVQIPVAIYFLLNWVDRKPKQTMLIIALQALAGVAAIAAVYFLT